MDIYKIQVLARDIRVIIEPSPYRHEEDGMPQALRKNSRKDDSAYTAGVLLGKRRNGRIFVADVINVRENGADVRQLIRNTEESDNALYGNVTVRIPQDPGRAGKDQAQSFVRMLGGFTVSVALESGDKVTRAEPFSCGTLFSFWQGRVEGGDAAHR